MDPYSSSLFGDMPSPHLPSLESSPPTTNPSISLPIHNPNSSTPCTIFNSTQAIIPNDHSDFPPFDDHLSDFPSSIPNQQHSVTIPSWLDDHTNQSSQHLQSNNTPFIFSLSTKPDTNSMIVISKQDDADSVDDTSLPNYKQYSNHLSQQFISPSTSIQPPISSTIKNSNPNDNQVKQELLTTIASNTTPIRGNVSHTRRCRAKVNNNFIRLLEALPPPPKGVEVKYKSQILSYAIDRFRDIRCQNMHLEMKLALSSPYQMQRWVRSVVSSSNTLEEALKPFMALVCLTKKWKYAELWAPYTRTTSNNNQTHSGETTALRYITGALPPTVQGEELKRLRKYRSNSRKFTFPPRYGVPGRVFLTMRPEWLPLLNDQIAFPRAPHAVRHKVEVTFAVPVIVNGSVHMVVEFFDTNRRDYDPETMNLANDIAVMFGKAFTGKQQ